MKTTHYYGIILFLLVLVVGTMYIFSNKKVDTEVTDTNGTQSGASAMSFFLTSSNPGNGANLGGLLGADSFCQSLATAVGAGDKVWRAYLSTQGTTGELAINARDRIGNGPWKNANGVVIANNLEELHNSNNITKETALTEKGEVVSGRGDEVNMHDILTGSSPLGLAIATSTDVTCGNWTQETDNGFSAMVGHHDRMGLRDDESSRSWNSSHLSRGCSPEALPQSGGAGLMYCFAIVQ